MTDSFAMISPIKHWGIAMRNLHRVTLELSSKAFTVTSAEKAQEVASRMFTQWMPLLRESDAVAVMLWLADGSEFLEWSGDLEQTFEWAYWIGFTNPLPPPEHPTPRDLMNTHIYPKKYRQDAVPRPYSWIKRIVRILKETGLAITGKPIQVIATFDNGPEFCISHFKYRDHHEICGGVTASVHGAVICNSVLHADHKKYAAFPDGIPEGTTLGHFMGAQFREYAREFGFDGLWLSNGMGFGKSPWGIVGFLFDKHEFHPERADEATTSMLQFWHDLNEACPGIHVENRGSNFSAGVEMASDGAPLPELYDDYRIVPPVNSPWAALNYNTGLEIAAWMSHIAILPEGVFPFRFYTHDPWFLNSPWLDRYERVPWDIYQPLSVARIREDGTLQAADRVSFITADNTYGELPDQVPNEVIPHILHAWDTAPDAAGPLVWLYPFRLYGELVRAHGRSDQVLREDLFLGEALQDGLPLNTVMDADLFLSNPGAVPSSSILVVPVSAYREPYAAAIDKFLQNGSAIFYGGITHAEPALAAKLGLTAAAPVTGEVTIMGDALDTLCDFSRADRTPPRIAHIHSVYEEGGLATIPDPERPARVLATARQGDTERVTCAVRGNLAYVEAILPVRAELDFSGRVLERASVAEVYPCGMLMNLALAQFGWRLQYQFLQSNTTIPRTTITRHDNAFRFHIFARDTTAQITLHTPHGAPVFTGWESQIIHGDTTLLAPGRFYQQECRCFIHAPDTRIVSARVRLPGFPEYTDRRQYSNLVHADVTFFPPNGVTPEVLLMADENNTIHGTLLDNTLRQTPEGPCVTLHDVTGNLLFSW